jgi:hypothetical protein
VVSDLGSRLAGELKDLVQELANSTEGIHDLKIDQSLAPTREVLNNAFAAGSSAFATGSSSLFKAFDGARTNIASKLKEREEAERIRKEKLASEPPITSPATAISPPPDIRATLGGIGSGIGSFFGSRVASFRGSAAPAASTTSNSTPTTPAVATPVEKRGLRPMSLTPSAHTNSTGKGRVVSGSTVQE